jgi:hypothetical protein
MDGCVLVWGLSREENGYAYSEVARPSNGLSPCVDCCAWTAAAACFKRDDEEIDLWSIISDILLFFRIGFLLRNELDFDSLVLPIGEGG